VASPQPMTIRLTRARYRQAIRTKGGSLRILYYSVAYDEMLGARTHARAFFKELARHPRVAEARIVEFDSDLLAESRTGRMRSLVRFLYRLLPDSIRTTVRYSRVNPYVYATIVRAVEDFRPDALVVRYGADGGMVRRLQRAFPELRIVVEYNGSPFDEETRGIFGSAFLRSAELRQLCEADAVSVVSEYLMHALVAQRPELEATLFLNPNGVDPDTFHPRSATERSLARSSMSVPDGALVLGYAGGMERWRRLPEIVSAVAEARRQGMQDVFLALIGAGDSLPEVMVEVAQDDDVFNGWLFASERWLEHDRVAELVAAFDVGLLSYAHQHICHQKLFEYLASGIPVLAPDAGIPASLRSEAYGVFAFETSEDLVALIRRCRENLEDCRSRAKRGLAVVVDEYTWAANADRVVSAIERVQRGQAGSRASALPTRGQGEVG